MEEGVGRGLGKHSVKEWWMLARAYREAIAGSVVGGSTDVLTLWGGLAADLAPEVTSRITVHELLQVLWLLEYRVTLRGKVLARLPSGATEGEGCEAEDPAR